MTPQVISLSSLGSTAWIPVDYKQNPFNIDIAVVLSNTPSLTYKVEYTLDDIFNPEITPTAFAHTTLTTLTTNSTGTIKSPVRAIRLTITSWTSGIATMTSLQGVVNPALFNLNGDLVDRLTLHTEEHVEMGVIDPIPLPRNQQIAAFGNLDLAGATVPVGVVMTTEDDANEFGGKVLKFTMAGAVTGKVVIIPLKSDLVAYPTALPNVHFRAKYSDLTTRLYVGLGNDVAAANRFYWIIVESATTKTSYGNQGPDRATKWVDTYRTYACDPYRNQYTAGSPATWDETTPEFEVKALHLTISCSGAATVYLSRVYSPEWDKARLIVQGDNAYQSFCNELGNKMIDAQMPGVLSVLGRDRFPGSNECLATDLQRYQSAGWDIIQHVSAVPTLTSILAGTTADQLTEYLARGDAAFDYFECKRVRHSSQYQNTSEKTTTLTDYSTVLNKFGIVGARGKVNDPEFGVQPWNDLTSLWNLNLSAVTPQFYVPPNGKYNRYYHTGGQTGSFSLKDNYVGSTVETLVNRCLAGKELGWVYFHQFYGDVGSPPADSNNTAKYASEFFAKLSSLRAAGLLETITLSRLEASTYSRPGPVFLRWDGEWVHYSDPTKIAF